MARERRRFGRTGQPLAIQYRHRSGELVSPWMQTATVNLSASGIRFKCQEPLPSGDLLQLRLQLPGGRTPLELQAQVVWCRTQAAGVEEVGAEFLGVTDQEQRQIDDLVAFLGADHSARLPE